MDELLARRLAKRMEAAPREIANLLHMYYQAQVGGDYEWECGAPRALMIIDVGDDEVNAHWAGYLTIDDLRRIRQEIDDLIDPERAERRRQVEEAEKERIARYYAEHPFKCRHERCNARFKTERGRAVHERSCRWIKYDKQSGHV